MVDIELQNASGDLRKLLLKCHPILASTQGLHAKMQCSFAAKCVATLNDHEGSLQLLAKRVATEMHEQFLLENKIMEKQGKPTQEVPSIGAFLTRMAVATLLTGKPCTCKICTANRDEKMVSFPVCSQLEVLLFAPFITKELFGELEQLVKQHPHVKARLDFLKWLELPQEQRSPFKTDNGEMILITAGVGYPLDMMQGLMFFEDICILDRPSTQQPARAEDARPPKTAPGKQITRKETTSAPEERILILKAPRDQARFRKIKRDFSKDHLPLDPASESDVSHENTSLEAVETRIEELEILEKLQDAEEQTAGEVVNG